MSWISDKFQEIKDKLSDNKEVALSPLGKYYEAPATEYQKKCKEDAKVFYEEKKWPDYAISTLDYIFGENQNNGTYEELENGEWIFGGLHGTIQFEGRIDSDIIKVESRILRTQNFKPSMLRQLLESSFQNSYIKYGINEDDDLVTMFYLEKNEARPDAIYDALKELCISADASDSFISTEYENVEWLNNDHVSYEPEHVFELKYQKYQSDLKEAQEYIITAFNNNNRDYIKIFYRLLGYFYMTDFLISPRNFLDGYITYTVSEYWNFLGQNPNGFQDALGILKEAIEEMKEQTKEQFKEEAVDLPYLFTTRYPLPNLAESESIRSHVNNMKKFYQENDMTSFYWSVQVIVGGLTFHNNLDPNWSQWVNSIYAMTDSKYMSQLNYLPHFLNDDRSGPDLEIIQDWLETAVKNSAETETPLPELPELTKEMNSSDYIYAILSRLV